MDIRKKSATGSDHTKPPPASRTSVLGTSLARPLHAVLPLVGQRPAVLASTLPELGGHSRGIDAALVPLVQPGVLLLLLRLRPLVLEGGPGGAEVPRRRRDVLGDVWVDVASLLVLHGWHRAQLPVENTISVDIRDRVPFTDTSSKCMTSDTMTRRRGSRIRPKTCMMKTEACLAVG